jgi:hypothetical protein
MFAYEELVQQLFVPKAGAASSAGDAVVVAVILDWVEHFVPIGILVATTVGPTITTLTRTPEAFLAEETTDTHVSHCGLDSAPQQQSDPQEHAIQAHNFAVTS